MKDGHNWRRVNKTNPCPICDKDRACKVSTDGAVAMCKRIEQGAFEECKGGWFLHRLRDSQGWTERGAERFNKRHSAGWNPATNKEREARKMRHAFSTAEEAISETATNSGGKSVAVWPYHDATGREVLRVVRFDMPEGGKEFRPIHAAKGGWKIGDPSGPLPLYRLPELGRRAAVWVCEGEKAADAARSIALNATTSAHGAQSADKSDWTPLAGCEVIILPDNDQAGRSYAEDVVSILVKLDPPARVKIVPLTGLPEGGDIVEFIADRTSISSEAIRDQIVGLANATPFIDAADVIGGPILTCMADVKAEAITWLWLDRMALGKLNLLCGDPGLGKSFVTLDMASRVSTGTPWPDGCVCPGGTVILMNAEDGLSDTIKPRLDAAGADPRKIVALEGISNISDDGKRAQRSFRLDDIPALATALKQHPDCKLVVIDPVSAYMGETDSHKNTDVRGLLAPLAKLAADHRVAVVLVTHLNKSAGGQSATYRATGSIAFVAACRSAWLIAKDKENPRRRLLLPIKNNLGNDQTGLAYSIIEGKVSWEEGAVNLTADDALASESGDGTPGPEPDARNEAVAWLREVLSAGPMAVADLHAEAEAAGHAWRTVHRAKGELGIRHYRDQHGGARMWALPTGSMCQVLPNPHNLASWHDGANECAGEVHLVDPVASCQDATCQDA